MDPFSFLVATVVAEAGMSAIHTLTGGKRRDANKAYADDLYYDGSSKYYSDDRDAAGSINPDIGARNKQESDISRADWDKSMKNYSPEEQDAIYDEVDVVEI